MNRRSFLKNLAGALVTLNLTLGFRPSKVALDEETALVFGETANAFPALKRSSGKLEWRLADDSGPWKPEAREVDL